MIPVTTAVTAPAPAPAPTPALSLNTVAALNVLANNQDKVAQSVAAVEDAGTATTLDLVGLQDNLNALRISAEVAGTLLSEQKKVALDILGKTGG